MTVIDLTERRRDCQTRPEVAAAYKIAVAQAFAEQGRELADLAAPVVEPFRQCEPDLEQHLIGAFLRWQMKQIKQELDREPNRDIAIGIAIETSIQAFTNRMIELQDGFDPSGGFAA